MNLMHHQTINHQLFMVIIKFLRSGDLKRASRIFVNNCFYKATTKKEQTHHNVFHVNFLSSEQICHSFCTFQLKANPRAIIRFGYKLV